jgi:hypothetical protein
VLGDTGGVSFVVVGLMRNCAGTERYKGLDSLDAGAGNRTSMNEFGCNKESMEE